MIRIEEKNMCCGCGACFNKCPKNAIEMIEDEKGFKYPKVNEKLCINCGLCNKVCPILNKNSIINEPKAYACYNNNLEVRKKSTSGGIFSLLASNIIRKNGVVFGASFNEKFELYHTYAETMDDISKFRGSKYLQSDIKNSYRKVKEFLDNDRYVLFTGTPCQIEGLINFLGKKYDKLVLQDIICHGVPSPKIWNIYKEYCEKKAKSKLTDMSFRSKVKEGWTKYHINMNFKNGESYDIEHNNDSYMKAFLNHLSLRDSCTNCKFKKVNRFSDITLADFWGIDKIKPELKDHDGISLVIVNSYKGQKIFDEIKKEIFFSEVNLQDAVKFNPSFSITSIENKRSNYFFKKVNSNNFDIVVNSLIPKDKILNRVKRKIKKILKSVIR